MIKSVISNNKEVAANPLLTTFTSLTIKEQDLITVTITNFEHFQFNIKSLIFNSLNGVNLGEAFQQKGDFIIWFEKSDDEISLI